MPTTQRLFESGIHWMKLEEEDFNRAVELLLTRIHGREALVIDGRGGDKGIDVAVRQDGIIKRIYQLKHFPEGFSGGFRDTRRRQITGSFTRACDNHEDLAEWILVVPRNPTVEEDEFVQGLAADREIDLEIWGQAKLDAALLPYPEIVQAITRNDTVELLARFNAETAALVGPDDLTERAEGLVAITESRSDYWTTNLHVVDGTAFESYIAKHPEAMEKEPIRTTIEWSFGEEHQDLQAKLQHAEDFGTFEPLTLPAILAKITRSGPDWVQAHPKLPKDGVISRTSQPVRPSGREVITFDVRDERGYSKGRFEGDIQARVFGTLGVSIKCTFANIATGVIVLPEDFEAPGQFTYHFDLDNAFIEDVSRIVDMSRLLSVGTVMDVYFNGGHVGKLRLHSGDGAFELSAVEEELIEDLLFLQRNIHGATFRFPREVSPRERVMLRVGRRLLEGHSTHMPPGTNLVCYLTGQSGDALLRLLREGGAIVSNPDAFGLESQGGKYDLGPVTFYHPNLRVLDADEVIQALESGIAEGMKVVLEPDDSTLVQVWPGSPGPDYTTPPPFLPWNLPSNERPDEGTEDY
ncbi:hypothetical protein [Citricoccus sp. I39-566]|uniref:hypothetical protein n=1 Tax=Citricoccus sp. I39-566 TaxID=3073268 RepID=UPI00286C2F1D|nr:hypothetical protein [Citricoccus sp. I39-566]WMY80075.1 hypothetical protein RE421_16495 [Citricoccus sp. I39-566]